MENYEFTLDGTTYVIPFVTKEEAEEYDYNTPADWRGFLKFNIGNVYVKK